ncbi:MAG: rRNA maturation RNase YbeY [Haemophilus parainfluenzae]|jgi:metalloprotein, YbeY family|nr:MAG: rRNA maturation RNase YbeY [Haemophilus parainfluenzae]
MKPRQRSFYIRQHKRLDLQIKKQSREITPKDSDFFRWIFAALQPFYDYGEIGLLLADKEAARDYNHEYRGKDYPTNVLSFPLPLANNDAVLRGDLIICPAVVEEEATRDHKSLQAHYAHLSVHGVLHLIGFDHIKEKDALNMENKEISILNSLGYSNPYIMQDF